MSFYFSGLQTLKVKETDRILALQIEMKKIGVDLEVTNSTIQYQKQNIKSVNHSVIIATYKDHRMAMSFSTLSLLIDNIIIENADVVSKSYPLFWEHIQSLGMICTIEN